MGSANNLVTSASAASLMSVSSSPAIRPVTATHATHCTAAIPPVAPAPVWIIEEVIEFEPVLDEDEALNIDDFFSASSFTLSYLPAVKFLADCFEGLLSSPQLPLLENK